MTKSEIEAHRVATEASMSLFGDDETYINYIINMARSTGELHIWLGVFRKHKNVCERLRRECGH